MAGPAETVPPTPAATCAFNRTCQVLNFGFLWRDPRGERCARTMLDRHSLWVLAWSAERHEAFLGSTIDLLLGMLLLVEAASGNTRGIGLLKEAKVWTCSNKYDDRGIKYFGTRPYIKKMGRRGGLALFPSCLTRQVPRSMRDLVESPLPWIEKNFKRGRSGRQFE